MALRHGLRRVGVAGVRYLYKLEQLRLLASLTVSASGQVTKAITAGNMAYRLHVIFPALWVMPYLDICLSHVIWRRRLKIHVVYAIDRTTHIDPENLFYNTALKGIINLSLKGPVAPVYIYIASCS